VLADVRERLRHDSKRLRLHVGVEPGGLDFRRGLDADGELRGLGDARRVGPNRRDQARRRPDRAAQAQDRLPDVHVDRPRRGRELAKLGARVVDPAGGKEAVDRLRFRVHVPEHLGESVMELARDPFALADDGQLAQARLQPRVLQGDRGLVCERRERLERIGVEAPRLRGPDREQADRGPATL
jgi:hypothetical protein